LLKIKSNEMAKSTNGTKNIKEALTPDQVSKVEDKYKSIYSGMLKGNKKKLMKYIDPKLKRPNPDAMAMGRAINLVKKETETVNEDVTDWPKELTSRYSDEYRFELEKVSPTYQDKPGRAKYRVIDIESGELKGTPIFGKPEHLMAYADDLIKPQGGTQSSHFGESLNEDNSYDSFKTDASERFLNRSQVVELLPTLKNSLNKLNFSPSKQPTLSVKRYGLSSSNKGYVISMYIPTSKDDIIVELGKYPKDDKTDEVSISLYLPNEEGRLTQVAYETSTSPKGEELSEDSNVLSKVISMANQWYEKPNTIDERLNTLVKEVYSEKQRKWACAQDGPEFDEMCKDTAISKKKLKEERTSTVSKARAKSELKQMLKGKRDDGMGKSTLKAVLAIDKDGKETKVKKLEDFDKFEKGTKFSLKETTMNNDRLTELIKAALTGPVKEDKTEDKKAAEILKSMVSPIKEDKVKDFQKLYNSHTPDGNPFTQNQNQLHSYNTDPEYKAWVDKIELEYLKKIKNGGDKEEIKILEEMLATFKKLRDKYAKLKKGEEEEMEKSSKKDLEVIKTATKGFDDEAMFESSTLKEGVWSMGTVTEIKRFLIDLQELKDKYYNIVGSDDVFDGLDRAERAAVEMMNNAPENRSMNEELATTPIKDDIYAIGSRIYKDPYEAISLVATDQTVVVRDFARKDKKFKAAVMDYVKSKGLETSVDRDGLYIDTKPLDFKGMPLMNEKSLAESIFKKLRG
tara:strand:+ start:2542 stop:4764 length:2223 start_codon:yes stop_codon:yes gene_type:complete